MRILKLQLQNFKAYTDATFEFQPRFNLIVGENGAGKTTILDGLAVALDAWTYALPGMTRRGIRRSEVRLKEFEKGGRPTFEPQYPSRVRAYGDALGNRHVNWTRYRSSDDASTFIESAAEANWGVIKFKGTGEGMVARIRAGESLDLPLIACYGTGRLWLKPDNSDGEQAPKKASVFDGYRDCFFARTSEEEVNQWFKREFGATGQGQVDSAVLDAVCEAVIGCVPDAAGLEFDFLRDELTITFNDRHRTPFDALSDGQRTLVALVGDIARRAITLNPHLGAGAVTKTNGVVLIDELDLHLHPRWQRDVARNLKRTFPLLQFFATTHSPQIIAETPPEEIMVLNTGGSWSRPARSIGLSANQVLRNIMGSDFMNAEMRAAFDEVFRLVENGDFEAARNKIAEIRQTQGDFPELVEAASYMDSVDATASNPES